MESRPTILMVDDVPMFRELGALFLARTGKVLLAGDGQQALDIVRRQRPDLVIADLRMPHMEGDDLCRAIRAESEIEQTPVIIMISPASAGDRTRAVLAGANDVLDKPLGRVALTECVNRFLRHGLGEGLPRVDLKAPVRMLNDVGEAWGTVRNISRGGIFIESDAWFSPRTEVCLRFKLPDAESDMELAPLAQVVWHKQEATPHLPKGMGMRFLEIDAKTMRSVDDYVYTRFQPRNVAQR